MTILLVLAGPNGSGKTSLYDEVVESPYFPEVYVSPDAVVASGKFAGLPTIRDQYLAAMEFCEHYRINALESHTALAFETVFSTVGKLEYLRTARAHGYFIELIFIGTSNSAINIGRVQQRVRSGGHAVHPEDIVRRYTRCMELLPQALSLVDVAKVYDNSGKHPESLRLGVNLECGARAAFDLREKQVRVIQQRIPCPGLITAVRQISVAMATPGQGDLLRQHRAVTQTREYVAADRRFALSLFSYSRYNNKQ